MDSIKELQQETDKLLARGTDAASDIVEVLVREAVARKASDLHIEPFKDGTRARFRLDGVLLDAVHIPDSLHERVIGRIKVMADLVGYRSDVPQEGRISTDMGLRGVELRVSTFPTIHGEKVVIRILDSQRVILRLSELGFSHEVENAFRDAILRPQGTVLLTGPSSSGKTTTIYTALHEIHEKRGDTAHIVTLEDPVEFDLGIICQTQINPYGELTFSRALRSILRQDPEVIMVGEIRDDDTAQIVIQAGLTGHLVISTIHSGTAAGAFTRLIKMGVEPFLIASSVSMVLAQRLVRIVCSECREHYNPEERLWPRFGFERAPGWKLSRGKGCSLCGGTGYRGRMPLTELLVVADELREGILRKSPTGVLEEVARKGGMKSLAEDGLDKVKNSLTTLEELARVLLPEKPGT